MGYSFQTRILLFGYHENGYQENRVFCPVQFHSDSCGMFRMFFGRNSILTVIMGVYISRYLHQV